MPSCQKPLAYRHDVSFVSWCDELWLALSCASGHKEVFAVPVFPLGNIGPIDSAVGVCLYWAKIICQCNTQPYMSYEIRDVLTGTLAACQLALNSNANEHTIASDMTGMHTGNFQAGREQSPFIIIHNALLLSIYENFAHGQRVGNLCQQ